MSIGDTITGTDHSGFVSKIDTIELGAKLRKRFEVTVLYPPSVPTSTFYIIEGIGSTLSLTPDAPDPPRDVELICMKTSDEVIYLSENYSFCPSIKEILVSNSHDVFEEDNIKIYPNPNNDFLNIETKSGRKVVEVKVFDPTGNLFYSTASFLKREKINTTTWPSGVYIVSFEINGRRFTKRFFKN